MSAMNRSAALTFGGGGFLSVAAQSAIISGLLALCSRKSAGKMPATLQTSLLLDRFGILSAVSGGAWFTSELIYSPRFLKLIESIASMPDTAGSQFNAEWILPYLGVAISRELVKLLKTERDWNGYVSAVLRATADIDDSVFLGSSVQTWAEDKEWLVATSLVLPTGENGLDGIGIFPPAGERLAKSSLSYKVSLPDDVSPTAFPALVPAKFSVSLGSDQDSPAPYMFVTPEAVPPNIAIRYSASGPDKGFLGCFNKSQEFQATSKPLGTFQNFNDAPGLFPVAEVAAASSAFFGDVGAMPSSTIPTSTAETVGKLANIFHVGISTWTGSGAHGKALSEPLALARQLYSSKRVTQETVDGFVENAVRATIDGQFTDDTGIAHAVAAGAKDVVALLNPTLTDQTETLINLFSSDEGRHGGAAANPGGTSSAGDASMSIRFEIFENTQADAREQFSQIARTGSLKISEENQTQLTSIVAGTFRNLVTKDEQFFGVEGGRHVNLHIVAIDAKLSAGINENPKNYAVLVQEIINTLLDEENETLVKNNICRAFVPDFLDHPGP